MNPRVSRSSALASKATGFPIAKIAAKLALGYTLDEIPNDITRLTPASFEPTIDYVVVKVPRWAFEKFPQADRTLTTQMKSVGEVMAIGRTFKEAFMKAFRSLELGRGNMLFAKSGGRINATAAPRTKTTTARCSGCWRCRTIGACGRSSARSSAAGRSRTIHQLTKIDRWFLTQFQQLVELKEQAALVGLRGISPRSDAHAEARRLRRLAARQHPRRRRRARCAPRGSSTGSSAAYKRIDTCAAEFESFTPYLYGTYEKECEADPTAAAEGRHPRQRPEPHRPGHRVRLLLLHAAFALRDDGFETVMINCNPETVSTDYDTVDRLYFEPLTFEDVLGDHRARAGGRRRRRVSSCSTAGRRRSSWRCRCRRPASRSSAPRPDSIDLAEDRQRFSQLLWDLGIPQAASGTATSPKRRARWRSRSAFRSSCGRRTCSAAAPWRSSTTWPRSTAT